MKLGFWKGWGKPLSVWVGATGGASAPATYSISGIVYDADGSTAVASATVAFGLHNTTSAANGTYTISNIPAGESGSMTCTKSGYSWAAISISAMSGNLVSQNYTNAWWAAGGCGASCIGAYRAKGAATYAASKVNLANPGTLDLTDPAGALTFNSANGWSAFASASRYFDTGSKPATTWTAFVQFTGAVANQGALFGLYQAAGQNFLIQSYDASNDRWYNGNATPVDVTPRIASGNLGIVGKDTYKNGSDVGTVGAGATAPTINAFLGCYNGAGTPTTYTSAVIAGFVLYNATLTAPQAAAVSAAMANF